MVKLHSSPVVVDKPSTAIQIIMGVPTDSVLICQRFGAEAAVRLCLIQFDDPPLAILHTGAMLAQFILNLGLR